MKPKALNDKSTQNLAQHFNRQKWEKIERHKNLFHSTPVKKTV